MKDEKYLVICGIFENKENAEARNDLLTKNGFNSVINTINI
jgi:cell division protein FtsN